MRDGVVGCAEAEAGSAMAARELDELEPREMLESTSRTKLDSVLLISAITVCIDPVVHLVLLQWFTPASPSSFLA
jgi:hypothetical protein